MGNCRIIKKLQLLKQRANIILKDNNLGPLFKSIIGKEVFFSYFILILF